MRLISAHLEQNQIHHRSIFKSQIGTLRTLNECTSISTSYNLPTFNYHAIFIFVFHYNRSLNLLIIIINFDS